MTPDMYAFFNCASLIRRRLSDSNVSDNITFGFEANGYPAHSEMKVDFFIRKGYDSAVRGTDPDKVVGEFLGRYSFDKLSSQPLLMGPSGNRVVGEEEAVAGTDKGETPPIPEGERVIHSQSDNMDEPIPF